MKLQRYPGDVADLVTVAVAGPVTAAVIVLVWFGLKQLDISEFARGALTASVYLVVYRIACDIVWNLRKVRR